MPEKRPPNPSATSTVEDYLKGLYVLQQRLDATPGGGAVGDVGEAAGPSNLDSVESGAAAAVGPANAFPSGGSGGCSGGGGGLVPLGQLAQQVGVTAGTATVMVKRLAERGLLVYEPRVGARLTARGELDALQVLRRHRLVELFLVEVMGLDWAQVHEEAEVLEHAISDRLLNRIDEMLGRPRYDPHGDPIPEADGTVCQRAMVSLAQCPVGEATVAQLADHSPAFLAFAKTQGLVPETVVNVLSRDAVADVVMLSVDGGPPMQLGLAAAGKVQVVTG